MSIPPEDLVVYQGKPGNKNGTHFEIYSDYNNIAKLFNLVI